jgi:hypothetical protein
VTLLDIGQSEAAIIIIGLIIGGAGLFILLPAAPIEYNTEVELEPGSFRFIGTMDGSGDTNTHSVRVLADPVSIRVILRCGANDFDVYVAQGYEPSEYDYDVRGFDIGGEDFTINGVEEGIWHFMVHSYTGAGQYELRVVITYQ